MKSFQFEENIIWGGSKMSSNIFHFSPKKMWMNDPNGLVFYEGEYHLFYQHNPNDIIWGPMHWGHAVSKDLIHWEHLPIAMVPDEIGGIYSGSAVVDWKDSSGFFDGEHGLIVLFTHHKEDGQVQSLAYSKDKGRTWTKYKGNPVIQNPGKQDFRDPKLFWHEDSQKWVTIIVYGDRVRFYSSQNLKDWDYTGEFGAEDGSHDGVWECPELFELPVEGDLKNKKWVLKVDVGNAYAGGSGGQYYIGHFDGKTFINDNPADQILWLDYSKDFYASQTWSNVLDQSTGKARMIWIAWMNNWQYANDIPATDYRGMMSCPRELSLKTTKDGIRLFQSPIPELLNLRNQTRKATSEKSSTQSFGAMEPGIKESINVDFTDQVQAIEVLCRVIVDTSSEVGFKIHFGKGEYLRVGFQKSTETLFIDRSTSGQVDFNPKFSGKFEVPIQLEKGNLHFQILIDKNTAEVFINGGRYVFSSLIFPKDKISKLEGYTMDGNSGFHELEIYQLEQ
jgi:fructan beta-fructosidase